MKKREIFFFLRMFELYLFLVVEAGLFTWRKISCVFYNRWNYYAVWLFFFLPWISSMTANTAKEWGVFIRLNFNNESNYFTQLKQDIFRDVPWEFEGFIESFL